MKRFLYDGDALVGEYSASGTLLRRYVHGPGVDEPLLWYEGAGLSDRRGLLANHQGSIVGVTNSSGALYRNTYEEYGAFGPSNGGRFSYTGQIVIPELALLHYKARTYNPALGRFLQTDPVGYDDDLNLYAYVGNDPLNRTDPTGMFSCPPTASYCINFRPDLEEKRAEPDKKLGDQMAAAGAVVGAIIGGAAGGAAGGSGGAVVGAACGPAAVVCSPAAAAAGAVEGAAVGAAGGAVAGGVAGGLIGAAIDAGIVLHNKAAGDGGGGRDRQFNGRPGSNTAQNRQVRDAARQEGLSDVQRRILGQEVERESRQGGANLGYQDIREMARMIKSREY